MKKNDIALIVLVVSLSLTASYFVLKAFIGEPSGNTQTIEKVEPISAELQEPSDKIFNKNAIDPTVVIEIGNPSNQQPFQQQ